MQTKTEKCKWCGRTHIVEQNPIYKSGGFGWNYDGHKGYCSNKCKLDAEGGKSSGSSNSNTDKKRIAVDAEGGKSSGSSNANSEMTAKNNAELARIQWEKEQASKQEQAEAKAKREAKANILKEQGKPFMSFVTLNPNGILLALLIAVIGIFVAFGAGKDSDNYIVGILISIVVVGIFGFGVYKYLQEYFKK